MLLFVVFSLLLLLFLLLSLLSPCLHCLHALCLSRFPFHDSQVSVLGVFLVAFSDLAIFLFFATLPHENLDFRGPGGPKMEPKWAPKRFENQAFAREASGRASGSDFGGPKGLPRGSRERPGSAGRAPGAPQEAQSEPPEAQSEPQEAPNEPQEAKERPQEGPGADFGPSGRSFWTISVRFSSVLRKAGTGKR